MINPLCTRSLALKLHNMGQKGSEYLFQLYILRFRQVKSLVAYSAKRSCEIWRSTANFFIKDIKNFVSDTVVIRVFFCVLVAIIEAVTFNMVNSFSLGFN